MNVREFLRQHDLSPKQSLAQNFLVDDAHLARIAAAANLASTDVVLEIGPGPGSLTAQLATQAGQVIGVELDDRLIEPLRTHFVDQPNVTIVHGDILALAPGQVVMQYGADWRQKSGDSGQGRGDESSITDHKSHGTRHVPSYKVVANLPYYITSAVLRHLLEAEYPPELIIVLVQKEVAERICAAPGNLSLLAISVQYYAKPTLVHRVPAGAFYPVPKVDSAVLRLERYTTPTVPGVETETFFRVVRAGFSQKRKQLVNTISAGLHLPKADAAAALTAADIDPRRRAETLTLTEWGALCAALANHSAVG
ncbi:MAG: rRNA adenine dimethyltransferase family protein [Caldilineaceae bacterium]